MGQVIRPDKFNLTKISSTQIRLPLGSVVTIGGQQYTMLANVDLTLSSLAANTLYMVYAVLSGGVVSLVTSTNVNSVGPAGYTSWKLVGAFYSNASSQHGGFVTIEGEPTTGWMDATTTWYSSGGGTVTKGSIATDKIAHRRVGDSQYLRVQYRQTSGGSSAAGNYSLLLPSAASADVAKILAAATSEAPFGVGNLNNNAGNQPGLRAFVNSSDPTKLGFYIWTATSTGGFGGWSSAGAFPFTDIALCVQFDAIVPISGWSNTPLKDL